MCSLLPSFKSFEFSKKIWHPIYVSNSDDGPVMRSLEFEHSRQQYYELIHKSPSLNADRPSVGNRLPIVRSSINHRKPLEVINGQPKIKVFKRIGKLNKFLEEEQKQYGEPNINSLCLEINISQH
ncbi:hypothetical protein ACFE04_016667 [Oxalis oulophora]